MAEDSQPSNYKQGYSSCTVANHERRTAESDASFLLPYIKKTDHILDIGCGPGTITTGIAKYASGGKAIGLDISTNVLDRAKALAAEAGVPTEGPGSVTFEQGDVLGKLPYPNDTFDIVYSCQLFGHIPPPDLPRQALTEMRRVLRPGGILASRSGAYQHFYPTSLDLDRLWAQNLNKVLRQGAPPGVEDTWTSMPAFFRSAGFDVDGGKVQVGSASTICSKPEARKWLAWRATGQLKAGDPFHQSWLDAGISENEIQETLVAVEKWAETEDAWFASLQCEILAWK